MSITAGVGPFSGIDTASLIEQLLAASSGQKSLAQQRLVQLQTQQAAYLDLNSRLQSLKSAAGTFRTSKTFDTKQATSTNEVALTATAGSNAQNGTFSFIVDRLVSTRQLLTRGFADKDVSAVGLDHLTVESAKARLDRDTALSDLNDGEGIARGKIKIDGVEVDLSKAATVQDVLDAINATDGIDVTATVVNGSFVLTSASGDFSVTNGAGYTTATSLGIAKSSTSGTLTGSRVYGINDNTSLATLNDGRGLTLDRTIGANVFDFTVNVGGTDVKVRLGEVYEFQGEGEDAKLVLIKGAVSNMGDVIERINETLSEAGFTEVTASLDADNGRLTINDTSGRDITITDLASGKAHTASDLGIAGTFTGGTVTGERIFAGLNSTLLSSINGGTGLGGDGSVSFTTADGSNFTVFGLNAQTTLNGLIDAINNDSGNAGTVTASLNEESTGIQIVDNTTGSGDLIIAGTDGDDTAASLGIAGTFTDNVAEGSNLQLAWIGLGTRLTDLNGGEGIGTGSFRITDADGNVATFDVTSDFITLNDIVRRINNNSTINVTARINDQGDGLIIEEAGTTPGAVKIKIEDVDGTVARELGIRGEASGVGDDNYIDGSYETTVEFDPNDTLNDIAKKINQAGVAFTAAVLNDGAGSTPYRLSITGRNPGTAGRFVLDTGDFDLGVNVLDEGQDARVFFGSSDPAKAVLIANSSNTLDGVITGVTVNLKSTSADPVELAITTDTEAIETEINAFVETFNDVLDRIDNYTYYDQDTQQRGVLLGDSTALNLRASMIGLSRRQNDGFTEAYNNLASVGISIGEGARLTFDRDKFRAALEDDPQAVEKLFTTRTIDANSGQTTLEDGDIVVNNPDADTEFSALGVLGQIEKFANDYINSIDGVLTARNRAITNQIQLQQNRITAFDAQLENKRTVLQKQFLAMEQAIASIQTQSQSLSQIASIG
ncbi:MAG: flagellar filament capping protein FliD [Phycisphaerales bacterium]